MLKSMILALAIAATPLSAAETPAEKHQAKLGSEKSAAKAHKAHKAKKSAKAKDHYSCPMDGGDFDKPGQCPKCHMDLVKVEVKK